MQDTGTPPVAWALDFLNWLQATLESPDVYSDSTREKLQKIMTVAPNAHRYVCATWHARWVQRHAVSGAILARNT
jgi:hypothetical protein